MNMQVLFTNIQGGGGGMLDLDETENKQFCHIQAAALTLWAFFRETLAVSSIYFPRRELEERVSPLFHH